MWGAGAWAGAGGEEIDDGGREGDTDGGVMGDGELAAPMVITTEALGDAVGYCATTER